MPGPKPHGKFSQQPVSRSDAAAARAWMQRLTALKEAWGVDSLRITRDLPDGGKVVLIDQGGIRKSIILNRLDSDDPQDQPTAYESIPIPFSGVIDTKIARTDAPEEAEVRLSLMTRRRLGGYDPNAPLAPEKATLRRFFVPMGRYGYDLLPQGRSPNQVYLQSSLQYPTWYSGTMAKLVQFAAGYGRQDGAPEGVSQQRAAMESASLELPPPVVEKIRLEMPTNPILPGYYGVPPYTGEIQFDFHHAQTDGVAFDTANKPWLVRVNAGGVIAMPLPVIPVTATKAFREYMEEVGDQELLTVLDTFGALPSGEGFPEEGKDFSAWRRAGVIIDVCSAGDFYSHMAYSSSCGWSFNSRGNEAYNTCFNGSEAEGIIGHTYHLSLTLGPMLDSLAEDTFEQLEVGSDIHAYMQSVLSNLGKSGEGMAARHKIRRTDPQDIAVRAQGWSERGDSRAVQAEVEYWHNLQMPPAANHSGSVRKYKSGALWLTEDIQLPDPFYGGCVNPMYRWLLPKEAHKILVPRFDTIVWAWFEDDDLKTLNMFYNKANVQVENEADIDLCKTVGSWSSKTHTGNWSIAGPVYSHDFDFRDTLGGSTVESTTKGSDLGFERTRAWVWFSPVAQWHSVTMSRHRMYRHDTKTISTSRENLFVAGCVPYFCRNALLFGEAKWHAGRTTTTSVGWGAIQDPYSYSVDLAADYATYFPDPDRGKETAWVLQEHYNPNLCNSFADNGPWMNVGDEVYQLVMRHKNPEHATWGWPDYLSLWHGGGSNPRIQIGSRSVTEGAQTPADTGNIWISMDNKKERVARKVDPRPYRMESPDENYNVFYRAAMRNSFGNARFIEIEEPAGADGPFTRFGHSALAGDKPFPYFMGVIHE